MTLLSIYSIYHCDSVHGLREFLKQRPPSCQRHDGRASKLRTIVFEQRTCSDPVVGSAAVTAAGTSACCGDVRTQASASPT